VNAYFEFYIGLLHYSLGLGAVQFQTAALSADTDNASDRDTALAFPLDVRTNTHRTRTYHALPSRWTLVCLKSGFVGTTV
jgi:hypothetical protein